MSVEAEPEEEAEEEEQTSPLDDPEFLREKYHDEDMTQGEIGELVGVTASTVSHYMKKHDVETDSRGALDERLDDPEFLREKYIEEEQTMAEIAEEVGCSDGTVMRRLHEHDIEVRRSSRGDDGEAAEEDDGEETEASDDETADEEADEE